ncbi:hypothetical protein VTO42DRAFT_8973 [Malbranchea cinnamomea]
MSAKQEKEAVLVMGTNSSSIVSKRSVERIYYPERHFFRHVVKRPQRRAPLINRGYWLRMHAIEQSVRQFLLRPLERPKVVINLGCGYDPLPFQLLRHEPELCRDVKFVDVDHRELMLKKRDMIRNSKELSELIPDASFLPDTEHVPVRSSQYIGIGCDLAEIERLGTVLRSEVSLEEYSILCFAEVSLTYMTTRAANSVIRWASGLSDDVQFCLLEQYCPDGTEHPFAKTMMKHFSKLRTPLYPIWDYPSLYDQEQRFMSHGWTTASARSLWELWSDSEFLNDSQAKSLDNYEAFDEWEEFALFASHYFLLMASTRGMEQKRHASTPEINGHLDAESRSSLALLPQCHPKFDGQRRFGAIVPINDDTVGLHGGSGRQTRLTSTDLYSRTTVEEAVCAMPPSTLSARMCHTITGLNDTDCLLVGGRSSPTTVLGDCWLRRSGQWRQVESLPVPLFRHSATRVKLPQEEECVLVYGGKTNGGGIFGRFLLWSKPKGWQVVPVIGSTPEPRFGASFTSMDALTGILLGGMSKRGRVLHDFWAWTLLQSDNGTVSIKLDDRTDHVRATTPLFKFLGRFGASTSVTSKDIIIVGGISGEGFVPFEHEYLFINQNSVRGMLAGTCSISVESARLSPSDVLSQRPLLVGHSSCIVDGNKVLVVGGGAVCFSFGTHWNEGTWVLQEADGSCSNQWLLKKPPTPTEHIPSPTVNGTNVKSTESVAHLTVIPRVQISTPQEFQTIVDAARPVIIEGLDIGPCVSRWSKEYLEEAVGRNRKVVVHEATSDHMNFQTKNFSYVTKDFGTFLDEVYTGGKQYLRATSSEKPTEVPANLSVDFPGLKDDFLLPPQLALVSENVHSSPLRISGPVILWLHYDVLANVLCQIRGEKRLILYPPWEVSRLGLAPGASSSSINVFRGSSNDDIVSPQGTSPHEAAMRPGDVLYLPPLWLHTASPTQGVSVAVNVFFRNLASTFYAPGRDVYGNRDLHAYEKGRRDVEKIVRSFERLPRDIARFYLDRLADELKERAGK